MNSNLNPIRDSFLFLSNFFSRHCMTKYYFAKKCFCKKRLPRGFEITNVISEG